jgi:CheY-like chemotaxis protein
MNRKVLIVEDHDSLRLLMGSFLSKSFDVVSAKNGLEAMGWLSKGELPDVIITDLRMPELNGNQFLSNLKCSGMFRDIPVVVISASENEDDERRYRALGARDFIRKPFNPVTLKERLVQIMPSSEFAVYGNSVA